MSAVGEVSDLTDNEINGVQSVELIKCMLSAGLMSACLPNVNVCLSDGCLSDQCQCMYVVLRQSGAFLTDVNVYHIRSRLVGFLAFCLLISVLVYIMLNIIL